MKLNAHERLLASDAVIAPSTSFKDENQADLGERQGEAFKQRQDNSIDVKSAYTPAFKPDGDSADVMNASTEEVESGGAKSELEAPKETKLTATLSTLSFLINADSTAVAEDPFTVENDFPPPQYASSTHGNGMQLESAPSPIEEISARSTHGMEVLPLVENQGDDPDLVSANEDKGGFTHGMEAAVARLLASVDPGSTANDNLNPYPDKIYPSTDGYLAAEAEEVEADINPSMFGVAEQPLGGMGG